MVTVPLGDAWLTLDFTRGNCQGMNTRWATYETSNPVVCRLIEESEAFRSGRIKTVKRCV